MIPLMAEVMRPFLAVIGARYRMLLQYRAAAFAGFATQLFWGAIKLMVLAAFYGVASAEPPMSMTQIIAYVWLIGRVLVGCDLELVFALEGFVVYIQFDLPRGAGGQRFFSRLYVPLLGLTVPFIGKVARMEDNMGLLDQDALCGLIDCLERVLVTECGVRQDKREQQREQENGRPTFGAQAFSPETGRHRGAQQIRLCVQQPRLVGSSLQQSPQFPIPRTV